MIAKKIPNPKKSGTKAGRVAGLAEYITEPEKEDVVEKCIYSEAVNFFSTDLPSQTAEMLALAQEAVKSKDPIDHWVLSLKEHERPTPDQAREAAAIFIEHCGLKGHQYIFGLHDDTNNMHIHIAVNRVNPETCNVIKINKGFDKEAAQQAIAIIEKKQGWSVEKNARYRTNDRAELVIDPTTKRPKIFKSVDEKQPQTTKTAQDKEIQTGEKSALRICQERAAPIINSAKSWAELHANLETQGFKFERSGSGSKIYYDDIAVKSSDVDRKATITALQKRLGPYQPPGEINPNEYHHHAQSTTRSPTGGIIATPKPNAFKTAKKPAHSLRTLSQCNLAHDKTSSSNKSAGILFTDVSINNREFGRLRRDARPAEPIKPDQPAWLEYQAIRAERSKSKASELLALRTKHDAEKAALYTKQRAEREDILSKKNWINKGDLRNALASVLATQQAAEKLSLREQHKEQRDALHTLYAPLPQYKAWLENPRILAPVDAMQKQPERLSKIISGLTHNQDKRGIAYSQNSRELFVDQGRNLAIVKHEQQTSQQIAVALVVAQQKFGRDLVLTGPPDFQRKAVEAAVAHDIAVSFADPALENLRKELLQNKYSARAPVAKPPAQQPAPTFAPLAHPVAQQTVVTQSPAQPVRRKPYESKPAPAPLAPHLTLQQRAEQYEALQREAKEAREAQQQPAPVLAPPVVTHQPPPAQQPVQITEHPKTLDVDVVSQGSFSGKILSVADGVATQRINRAGDTVQHDVSRLSAPVAVGDVVDVQYRDGGVGVVGGLERGAGVGR